MGLAGVEQTPRQACVCKHCQPRPPRAPGKLVLVLFCWRTCLSACMHQANVHSGCQKILHKGSQGQMLVLGMAVREEALCKLDGGVDVEML